MKKNIYTLLSLVLLWTQAIAQQDQRTVSTRIADLLAQVPAANAGQLKKNAAEFAALGKPGIVQLISGLSPAGKGDNTALEFAIGGFTYYVSQSGNETWRKLGSEAYCEALTKLKDKENQSFLIFQLQQIAKDEAVPVLAGFLNDNYLAGPAARALVKTGAPAAGQALNAALDTPYNTRHLAFAEALGDLRYNAAVPALERLARNEDASARKVALYALSNIGSPSSEPILSEAALKVNFGFDVSNATASYLNLLNRLADDGKVTDADKAAQSILKAAKAPVGTRTAAVELLARIQKGDNTNFLIRQFTQSKEPQVRAAILKIAGKNTSAASISLWVNQMRQAAPELKKEIAGLFGTMETTQALPALNGLLSSKSPGVKIAAIRAIGNIGAESSIPVLLNALKTANTDEIGAIKNALLITKGESLTAKIAAVLPRTTGGSKAALIDVLSARASAGHADLIFAQLNSKDDGVRSSAFSALKNVAGSRHLPQLFSLLETGTQEKDLTAVQDAVKTALKGTGNTDQQTDLLLGQLNTTKNKPSILPVFAGIGGKKALQAVTSSYNTGENETRAAALQALSNWSDDASAPELLAIARKSEDPGHLDLAIKGYLKATATSAKTPVQKVIMLREIAAVAKTPAQKEAILKELQKNRTFNALIFAGSYLSDSPVAPTAAQAVMNIALANKDFNGSEVRSLLTKASTLLKGGDADYQREAIRKYLAEMPAGEGYVSLFNGKDLTGWKGLVANPIARAKMGPDSVAIKQVKADEIMRSGWAVRDGELVFTGKGQNLCTVKQYGDFEMYVDWKIDKKGDAGIYLRGTPPGTGMGHFPRGRGGSGGFRRLVQ